MLMILGAIAAGASFATGDMEADRIWNALGQPAREVLHRHGQLGEYLAITFGILAVWRILIQSFGFMAGSRAIYLIVAILAVVTLGYSAHLGGVLVYDYGAGTALMASEPAPSEAASPAAEPSSAGPIPTVSVPTPSGDLDGRDSVGDGVCDQRGQHGDPGANHCTVGFGDRGDDVTQLEARHKF